VSLNLEFSHASRKRPADSDGNWEVRLVFFHHLRVPVAALVSSIDNSLLSSCLSPLWRIACLLSGAVPTASLLNIAVSPCVCLCLQCFLSRVETLIEQESKDPEYPDLKSFLHTNEFQVRVRISAGTCSVEPGASVLASLLASRLVAVRRVISASISAQEFRRPHPVSCCSNICFALAGVRMCR
jgi:hypothetical protein